MDRHLAEAIAEAVGAPVAAAQPVAGGDLNDGWRADLADGRRIFVKTAADAPAGGYTAEAAGLRWLAEPEALPVATPLAVVDPAADDHSDTSAAAPVRLLALEWIDPGRLDAAGEEELGRGLARLHAAGAPRFGAFGGDPAEPPSCEAGGGGPAEPLRIGPLELPNGPAATWPELYAEHRLRPTARLAAARGALDAAGVAAVERICARLPELAGPPEPPARLHGDLWSGNVLADREGRPHLIDPAAHGGHREVDLAMLRLFGGPADRCFAAYEEIASLAADHRDRVALWQLFPLLVHAALFGGHYGAAATAAARRYL